MNIHYDTFVAKGRIRKEGVTNKESQRNIYSWEAISYRLMHIDIEMGEKLTFIQILWITNLVVEYGSQAAKNDDRFCKFRRYTDAEFGKNETKLEKIRKKQQKSGWGKN